MKKVLLSSLILFLFSFSFAQKGIVKGVVKDAVTGETLIGVNVSYTQGKGDITDENGVFEFKLDYGTYNLKISYVSYEEKNIKIKVDKPKTLLNIKLSSKTLKEVEVIADVAKTRETPVAFSTVKPQTLDEELANQDIPLVLNRTPGVYATQQGGGDGDSRINIRGFSQRNIAVMIDGVPVNDMENGWVYWSNWFGLDMVTRSIQVQRGLGASKLALPSVGGTMNIITQGIENKRSFSIKQDIGNDGYSRTSFGINSGKLKNDWSFSLAGSYKRGNGWVDMTWTQGYFIYLRVDKKIGNHRLSLQGYGAPQSHGQRAYSNAIHTFSNEYAKKVGIDSSEYIPGQPNDMGLRYNQNWGYINRWELDSNGDTIWGDTKKLNEKTNYYFKPQISLRDVWSVNNNFYISTIAYLSIGNGGGTGFTASSIPYDVTGQKDFQFYYDSNKKLNGTPNEGKGDILYSGVNKHFWLGLLSTFDWKINDKWELSGGIDLRDYKGEHYREVYDLMGSNKYLDRASNSSDLNNKTNPSFERGIGDIIGYHNDGLVRWGGLFSQIEYKTDDWTVFANITGAFTGYKRIDYYKKYDLLLDDTTIYQAVGYSYGFDPEQMDFRSMLDTLYYNGEAYTMNSDEARIAQTDWFWRPSFTLKLGANYNISETMNVFFNTGFLNKAPRFANVYDYNNKLYEAIANEKIRALELGYSYYNTRLTFNLNGYITEWNNKPASSNPTVLDSETGDLRKVNIKGMDALHKGIEMELGVHIADNLLSETVLSFGDWIWTSAETAELVDPSTGNVVDSISFDAKGIKVGDAAQTQVRESIRWEIIKNLYVRASFTYYGNYYSDFDPFSLDPNDPTSVDENGDPKQSWKIPDYYLVDFGGGYSFKIKNSTVTFRLNIMNLLNQTYISDASNNDRYINQPYNSFDARSAAVFFGMGRRFMTSLQVKF